MSPTARRGERAWLAAYDPSSFPPFAVTVDLAIFTLRAGALSVLLVERGGHPFKGLWALPGGHIKHSRESAEMAAVRELAEETGIDLSEGGHIEQLATYSAPGRDPRIAAGLHVVTVAFVALVPELGAPSAGSDASGARWWPVPEAPQLAFDHGAILTDAIERIRSKLEYTTLATRFLREPFSLADLRSVYLAVWGVAPDLANFRRKVLSTEGAVEEVGLARRAPSEGGRPALLYRRGPTTSLDPPLRRVVPPASRATK